MARWKTAVRRSLDQTPPRTRANWNASGWGELAQAFAPATARAREKRVLRKLLLASDDRQLGALPEFWELLASHDGDEVHEERLHTALERRAPVYGALVQAIRTYEAFARRLQDAFDVLRAEAAAPDARGFVVPTLLGTRPSGRASIGSMNVSQPRIARWVKLPPLPSRSRTCSTNDSASWRSR